MKSIAEIRELVEVAQGFMNDLISRQAAIDIYDHRRTSDMSWQGGQTMTEAEIITRLIEGHGRCDTCEYEHYPKSVRPCEDCIYQEDRRSDNWKPKEAEHAAAADCIRA